STEGSIRGVNAADALDEASPSRESSSSYRTRTAPTSAPSSNGSSFFSIGSTVRETADCIRQSSVEIDDPRLNLLSRSPDEKLPRAAWFVQEHRRTDGQTGALRRPTRR